jgi:hypothetical protein
MLTRKMRVVEVELRQPHKNRRARLAIVADNPILPLFAIQDDLKSSALVELLPDYPVPAHPL